MGGLLQVAHLRQKWIDFLAHIDPSRELCPVFYQFVTDTIMEELIKHNFPANKARQEQEASSLDYEQHNAILLPPLLL